MFRIQLDGPASRVTDHEIEKISGRVLGARLQRAALYVNDIAHDIALDGSRFTASVPLRPGTNSVRMVATDLRGSETQEMVTVRYVPPLETDGIAILSPRDGQTLPSDSDPIVLVEGQVNDRRLSTVWLVANQERVPVRVSDGKFSKAVAVFEPTVRLRAETEPIDGRRFQSRTVVVHGAIARLAEGALMLEWPGESLAPHEIVAAWRSDPSRLDVPAQSIPLRPAGVITNGVRIEIFYLAQTKPGVYTFTLRYPSSSTATGPRATLYVPHVDGVKARPLPAASVDGRGQAVLARILIPYGVLWEQDEWFTGQSASGDATTKFRFPEGVSWTERNSELRP